MLAAITGFQGVLSRSTANSAFVSQSGQLAPLPDIKKTFAEDPESSQRNRISGAIASVHKSVGFQAAVDSNSPSSKIPPAHYGLLLGQDVTLFGYDMPALEAKFEYSQVFPIFGPLWHGSLARNWR